MKLREPKPTTSHVKDVSSFVSKYLKSRNTGASYSSTPTPSPTALPDTQQSQQNRVVSAAKGKSYETGTNPYRAGLVTSQDILNRPEQAVPIIREQQQAVNELLSKMPKNNYGQLPLLSPDTQIGDWLYFDSSHGEITGKQTDTPLYIDPNSKALSMAQTDVRAKFTTDYAYTWATGYEAMLDYMPTALYDSTQGQTQVKTMTEEQVENYRYGYKDYAEAPGYTYILNDNGEPVYFTPREPKLVGKALNAWNSLDVIVPQVLGATTADIPVSKDESKNLFTALLSFISSQVPPGSQPNRMGSLDVMTDQRKQAASVSNLLATSVNVASSIGKPILQAVLMGLAGTPTRTQAGKVSEGQGPSTPKETLEAFGVSPQGSMESLVNAVETGAKMSNAIAGYKPTAEDLKSDQELRKTQVELVNTALSRDYKTNSEDYKSSLADMTEYYRLQSKIGIRNVNAAWTWINDPDKQQHFNEMAAQVSLQKGAPLTYQELLQLKPYFTDALTELTGEMVFSVQNALNIPAVDILPDSWMTQISKTIPNANQMQLDGLIVSSAIDAVRSPIRKLADVFGETFLPDVLMNTKMNNLWFDGVIPYSNHQLSKMIYNDATNLIGNYYGGAAELVGETPSTLFSDLNRMGLEIVNMRKAGNFDDDIIDAIVEGGDYPANLLTKDRVRSVMRMVAVANPLENPDGWTSLMSSSYDAIVKERKAGFYTDYLQKIDYDDLAKPTGDAQLDDILKRVMEVEEPQRLKFLANELDSVTLKKAMQSISSDELGQAIGATFSRIYKDAHSMDTGIKGFQLMDDSARGIVDKALTDAADKGLLPIKGGKQITLAVRNTLRSIYSLYDTTLQSWVRNILTRVPRMQVFQGTEQLLTYDFSGAGSVVSRSHDWLTNTPALLESITEMPLEARRGFVSMLGLEDVQYADDLVDFFKENPNAWLPLTGSYNIYFHKAAREEYTQWLQQMLESKGISDLVDQQKFLQDIGEHSGGLYKTIAPNGDEIISLFGKPLPSTWAGIKILDEATTAAPAGILSANELITKAKIAHENYVTNYAMVNPVVLEDALKGARETLLSNGIAEETANDILDNMRTLWNDANGNAGKFAHNLDDNVAGISVGVHTKVPAGLNSIPTGMDMQEQASFTSTIKNSLDTFLTDRRVKNLPITESEVRDFFKRTAQGLAIEANEAVNPAGITGFAIFGDDIANRPISDETRRLFEKIDAGTIPSDTIASNISRIKKNGGWKLHLATDNVDEVSNILSDLGYTFKVGRSSGQVGKDITIYVGSRVDANILAAEISDKAAGLIKSPVGDTLIDDVELAPNVMGRFDIGSSDKRFHQYGINGVPFLNDDMLQVQMGTLTKEQAMQKAQMLLQTDYGEYFSGKYSPTSYPSHYTSEIQDILTDNGIDYEGKSLKVALSELQIKLRPIGWTPPELKADAVQQAVKESLPAETIKTSYWKEIEKSTPEVTVTSVDALRNWIPGDDMRLEEVKAYATRHADEPMAQAQIAYTQSVGKLYGIEKNLDALSATDEAAFASASVIRKARESVDTYMGRVTNKAGGFFSSIFPAYDYTKGAGTGSLQNFYFDMTQNLGAKMVDTEKAYLDAVLSAAETGGELPRQTIGDFLSGLNIKAVSSDGFNIDSFELTDQVGMVHTFDPSSRVYQALQDNSYFGVKNMEVWKAPIDLADDDLMKLKLLNIAPNPIFKDIPAERYDDLRKGFIQAYISKPMLGTNNLRKYLEPFAWGAGKTLDDMSPDEIVTLIRSTAAKNVGNVADDMNDLASHIEDMDNYFYHNHLLGDATYAIPEQAQLMPERYRIWANLKAKNAGQMAGMQNVLKQWEDSTVASLNDGSLFIKPIPSDATEAAKVANRSLIKTMAEMEDRLWHGGKIADFPLEGAIPYMSQRMRVGKENVVDQFAKGIVPFWNFASRGSATWLRIAVEHPSLLGWYGKYLKYSKNAALRAGLTNSKGDPLPSTIGKIPLIGGTGIWFNPTSIEPFFNFFFNPTAQEYYDDENPEYTSWQSVIPDFKQAIQSRGIRVGPWVDTMLALFGVKDAYTTQTWQEKSLYYGINILVPADLIPPWGWNQIDGALQKMSLLSDTGTVRSQVQWFDYLVESKIYEDYLNKIRATSDKDSQYALIKEVYKMLDEREANPKYSGYVKSLQNSNYYNTLTGWFTGIYPKEYTAGATEIYALRDKINMLKRAINDDMTATMFELDGTATQRYNTFNDIRYKTGEGLLYGARSASSWVTDPLTGDKVADDDWVGRRAAISKAQDLDVLTNEMYAEEAVVWDDYEKKRRTRPIGKEYNDPLVDAWRNEAWQSIASIEFQDKYKDVTRTWTAGYKPQELVEEHYRGLWWKLLDGTRPTWDAQNEDYKSEYLPRLRAWEADLPNAAKKLASVFTQNLAINFPNVFNGQDVVSIADKLVAETNLDGYNNYEMSKDTPVDALSRAWEETYWNPYWDMIGVAKGYQLQLMQDNFFGSHPKPTTDELIAWVQQQPAYQGKWTDDELRQATMTAEDLKQQRQVLDVQTAQDIGKTEPESKWDEMWNLYGWIPPDRKSEFYKTFAMLNGNSDALDTFFNVTGPNAFKSSEDFNKLYTDIQRTIAEMGVTAPTGSQLQTLAYAQTLNDNLTTMLKMSLGDTYSTIIDNYFALDKNQRKEWRRLYPDQYDIIQKYYDLRDQYAKQYPLWAEYYYSKSSSGGGGGYGYYRSGGGGSYVKRGAKLIPLGQRSTMDIQQLVTGQKQLGGGSKSSWLPKGASSLLGGKIDSGATLTDTDKRYLMQLRATYPELSDKIDPLLSK